MTTAKRLTKAQKANLAESEVKALAGHHQAVAQPTIEDSEQDRLADEFSAEAKAILGFVLAGGVASITGDQKHGFIRGATNLDTPNELVRAMVDVGLLVFTSFPHHQRGLYRLAVGVKGREYLDE